MGVAQAALDESVRYAQIRKTFGKPIAQHQAIQLKLADMATRTEAARLLVAPRRRDVRPRRPLRHGGRHGQAVRHRGGMENATEAMRIHGGYGYSKEFTVERSTATRRCW